MKGEAYQFGIGFVFGLACGVAITLGAVWPW